jgi:hypothetical protein
MNIKSLEYKNNQLVLVSLDSELMKEILEFKREVIKLDPKNLISYHECNNNVDVLEVLNDTKLVSVFHQDSERDVFILSE